ncbi:hypothetical protein STA3757_06960 [Stanieria sp. NIES-3757]|nr:hypothetical protein STA3757_06960 [Stanieria sp. NIES-3757]
MNYNPKKHQRRSIRLQGYDYSQAGYYFVTICCYQKQCLFGEVIDGVMQLNQYGEIVEQEWMRSSLIRQEIGLDRYIVMPNHFHGIVIINPVGVNGRSPLPKSSNRSIIPSMKPKSLSSLMAGFKSSVTKQINLIRNAPGTPVWQRNYYEHIIRNEESLNKIREYIINNPWSWQLDQLHPNNPSKW